MKNFLITAALLLLFLSVTLSAQPQRGNIVLGGTINYSSNKYQSYPNYPNDLANETISQLMVSPSFGIFVSDQFMYGLALGYSSNKTEDNGNDGYTSDNYSSHLYFISPFLRYYNYFNSMVGIFTELSFSYGSGEIESMNYQLYEPYSTKFDITSYTISLKPGISLNLSNKLLIEASVGLLEYNSTTFHQTSPTTTKVDDTKNSTIGISFNLNSLELGVQILF
jgi:hypothetical protein